MAARSASKSAASAGNSPQNTTGMAGRNPGSGSATGFLSSVMVSPTRVSATSLIEAVRKPISPGPSSSALTILGVNTQTRSASSKQAIDDSDEHHHAEISFVQSVDQQRLDRRRAVAPGR